MHVVVNSYSEDITVRTAEEVEGLGRRALAMADDSTQADMIVRMVQETLESFGKIDIVVNNVGSGRKTRKEPEPDPLGKIQAGMGRDV